MSLIVNGEYTGKFFNEIIRQVLPSMSLVKAGVRLLPGYKCKVEWYDLTSNFTMNPYTVCPPEAPEMELNQRIEDLCEIMMVGEISHKALNCTPMGETLAAGFMNERALQNRDFRETILGLAMEAFTFMSDDIMLNGSVEYGTEYLATCNGLRSRFAADTTVTQITSVPANITQSGVTGEMDKLLQSFSGLRFSSMMETQYGKPTLFVSSKIFDAYQRHLSATGATSPYFANMYAPDNKNYLIGKEALYLGRRVVELTNLPENEMFYAPAGSIAIFFDAEEDFSRLLIVDQQPVNLCDKVLMKMQTRFAPTYWRGEWISWYRPDAPTYVPSPYGLPF